MCRFAVVPDPHGKEAREHVVRRPSFPVRPLMLPEDLSRFTLVLNEAFQAPIYDVADDACEVDQSVVFVYRQWEAPFCVLGLASVSSRATAPGSSSHMPSWRSKL